MDDTELTLFQEYFEEDQLHQDDYEETVGRRMDCDGGKISENDAFMHNDHKYHKEVYYGCWKLARCKIYCKTVITKKMQNTDYYVDFYPEDMNDERLA
ncbi:hypothetical protein OUZ56_005598 [Daphnia magna]|uniref:Uncharacterized protein n=1 Tax=Daphnia magna TaxID=35525 RepID=A0ABQ9YT75_9CRUS|nr:hypothetical protein OUZ56_005598 [Daphnia magna]